MAGVKKSSVQGDWLEASGLLHIFRTLGLAVQPAKLGVGLVAIIVTMIFGWALDGIWKMGGGGVDPQAIGQFIQAHEFDQPYADVEGDRGIFETWREHERLCVLGLLGSSVPGASVAAGTPLGAYMETHSRAQPLRNFSGMLYGDWWLLRHHTVYAIIFLLGLLLIWSLAGGAICRMAAVQFAHDEKITVGAALAYARPKLWGGFFLAQCIPLAIILIVAVLLALGGVLLRFPVLGDLLGGVMFPLALIGGFIISIMLLGLLVGGAFFWPAVATEGADAFDAFSRGLSYPLSRPWKWALYTILTVIYASICWVFVNLFTFVMLKVTRGIVGFGTSPFGWWSRGEGENSVSKMELLWPLGGPNTLYSWPDWSQLTWYEHVSAVLIGFFVLIVIGLMWSFLASFYFSASTIVYFLLRRDVDGADLEDVHMEEELDEPFLPEPAGSSELTSSTSTDTAGGATSSGISLPVLDDPPPDDQT